MPVKVTCCILLAGAALLASPAQGAEAPLCAPRDHDGMRYTVCTVDLDRDRLQLFWSGRNGAPLGSLSGLASELKSQGQRLRLGMNAGMYDFRLAPVGLYIENGREARSLNKADGAGNFHLKPNGVFFLRGRTAGVIDSERYARANLQPDFATQSGPMLVINGRIHPKFGNYGKSAKYRNGVGVLNAHTVVFAISTTPVTFPQFASLFRDALKCQNALYLDGTVSSLYAEASGAPLKQGDFWPIGPMIGVIAPAVP